MCRQVFSHSLESRASAHITANWEKNHQDYEQPLFFLLSFNFFCRAWRPMVQHIPLVSLGQLSCPCLLSISCPPQAYSLWGQRVKNRRPWSCASTFQQQSKHWCVNISATKPKHSTLWAAMKKMYSIPASSSTEGKKAEDCIGEWSIFQWSQPLSLEQTLPQMIRTNTYVDKSSPSLVSWYSCFHFQLQCWGKSISLAACTDYLNIILSAGLPASSRGHAASEV